MTELTFAVRDPLSPRLWRASWRLLQKSEALVVTAVSAVEKEAARDGGYYNRRRAKHL